MNIIRIRKSFDIHSMFENKGLEESVRAAVNNPNRTSRDKKPIGTRKTKKAHNSIPNEYYYLAYRI